LHIVASSYVRYTLLAPLLARTRTLGRRTHRHHAGCPLSPQGSWFLTHGAPCSVARLDSPCHSTHVSCTPFLQHFHLQRTCFSPDMSLSSLTFFLVLCLSTCKLKQQPLVSSH
jgi:hypothetical protein